MRARFERPTVFIACIQALGAIVELSDFGSEKYPPFRLSEVEQGSPVMCRLDRTAVSSRLGLRVLAAY